MIFLFQIIISKNFENTDINTSAGGTLAHINSVVSLTTIPQRGLELRWSSGTPLAGRNNLQLSTEMGSDQL